MALSSFATSFLIFEGLADGEVGVGGICILPASSSLISASCLCVVVGNGRTLGRPGPRLLPSGSMSDAFLAVFGAPPPPLVDFS